MKIIITASNKKLAQLGPYVNKEQTQPNQSTNLTRVDNGVQRKNEIENTNNSNSGWSRERDEIVLQDLLNRILKNLDEGIGAKASLEHFRSQLYATNVDPSNSINHFSTYDENFIVNLFRGAESSSSSDQSLYQFVVNNSPIPDRLPNKQLPNSNVDQVVTPSTKQIQQ